MILILTTEQGDYSHIKIIDWLSHLQAKFMVLSGEMLLKGESKLVIYNNEIYINEINLTKEVTCVFYRRWFTGSEFNIVEDNFLNISLNRNLTMEMYEIRDFLYTNLKSAKWFPDADSITINKISVLQEAKNVGIDVPDYIGS